MSSANINPSASAELLKSFGQMLDEKLVPITDRLGKIEHSLSYAMEEITKISALEENNQIQQKEYQKLKHEFQSLKEENKLLEEQIVTQETYSRKKNIRIVGIKSQNNQGLEDSIIRVMRKVGINLSPREIERVNYITQDRRGENSPVIVQFLHWKDKQSIMTKKDKLCQDNIYIQEDYPKVIEERHRMLIPVFIKALELYPDLQPKLYVDKINLRGKVYTVDNIQAIQYPDLLPENVFTPAKSGIQAFYSKYSPVSNHYPARFEAEGKVFITSDQYFTYKKALHLEDTEVAQRISETTDPAKI